MDSIFALASSAFWQCCSMQDKTFNETLTHSGTSSVRSDLAQNHVQRLNAVGSV